MRAFENRLNGKKLCVAGLDQGSLLFGLACTENRNGRGDVGLNMTGILPTLETIRWHRGLRMNDEVQIKVVEVTRTSKYKTMQKAPRDPRKYEKAYVRRMAKEFGWTIQAKQRSRTTATTKHHRKD